MKNLDLTEAQEKVYKAIALHIRKKKYSPSIQELCVLTGLKSTSTIYHHLIGIKAKGFIDFEEKNKRTITLKRTLSK